MRLVESMPMQNNPSWSIAISLCLRRVLQAIHCAHLAQAAEPEACKTCHVKMARCNTITHMASSGAGKINPSNGVCLLHSRIQPLCSHFENKTRMPF